MAWLLLIALAVYIVWGLTCLSRAKRWPWPLFLAWCVIGPVLAVAGFVALCIDGARRAFTNYPHASR